MNKILAIHGIIGSGKDTIISIIKYHIDLYKMYKNGISFNKKFIVPHLMRAIENKDDASYLLNETDIKIERFALPLKSLISSFLGIDINSLNSQEVKKLELDSNIWYNSVSNKLSIRDLHTIFADAIKSYTNNDIFASTCLMRCKNSKNSIIIINDLRFETELYECIQNHAYLVKIKRTQAEIEKNEKRLTLHNAEAVLSEVGLDDAEFDFIIQNDSTYIDLSLCICNMLLDAGLIDVDYYEFYKSEIN